MSPFTVWRGRPGVVQKIYLLKQHEDFTGVIKARLVRSILCRISTVAAPGRLVRQLDVVVEAAGLKRRRLLQWIVAYAGLSAAWFLGDGDRDAAEADLAVARLAAVELAARRSRGP
jgi:streptomycin 6-kinase